MDADMKRSLDSPTFFLWTVLSFGFLQFSGLHAQNIDYSEDLPLFELDEYEVVHSETDFAPEFTRETPSFNYFDIPELPNGDLIIALEFMDQYRDARIPGNIKWAGILSFPVIDGYENNWLKFICLYLYEDRMFGFDASAATESERRFAVPIQFNDRTNREVLFRFAESFVERVYPGGEQEVWMEETIESGVDEEGTAIEYADGYYETFTIDPGRIAPVLPSQKGLSDRELVKMIYQYLEPNPNPVQEAEFGKPEGVGKQPFTWAAFKADLQPPDYIRTAAEMVVPRWYAIARLYHDKKILGIFDAEGRHRVLLFNIGLRIYAYDHRAGVWRTRAKLEDLKDLETLPAKLVYPGIKTISKVELLETIPGF
jgi:hypothetical protein